MAEGSRNFFRKAGMFSISGGESPSPSLSVRLDIMKTDNFVYGKDEENNNRTLRYGLLIK